MRAPTLRLLFALVTPLVTVSCSGTQSAAPAVALAARDYFPLRQGAAWSFDSTDLERGGLSSLVAMSVVRDDGAGGYYVRTGNHGAPALYEYASGGLTRNGELVLREPLEAGQRWRGRSGDDYVIRSVALTRTVPAGTFHNVIEVVHTAPDATLNNGTEFRETYFYAPRVGLVEAVLPILLAGHTDVRHFRLVLRGYTLDGRL